MDVNALTGTIGQTPRTNGSGMAGLSGTDFMNLLIRQLQYQDPLQPMTNEEMMKQMATIRELEMNTRLTARLEQLTDQQRFGSAAALIGRQVRGTVTDEQGNPYVREGVVRSVVFTPRGEVLLQLDNGDVLPLADLEEVTEAPAGAAQVTAPAAG
ncbi:MAG: hypothetical protein HRF43_13445 [Phycisphaerae bacterium]|jgi:flagellar basal-body rod modification protein FlgD